jgi:hypothetical protein
MRTPAGTSRPERLAIESAAHEAHNRAQEMTTATARSLRGLAAKVRAILPWEHQIEEGLVRNAFAHSPSPVRFSTAEIESACALLKLPAPVGKKADDRGDATGRQRFRLACERTGTALRYVPGKATRVEHQRSDF